MTQGSSHSGRPFDQVQYWIERHETLSGDPRSVGNRALSREENEAIERRAVEVVGALLDTLDTPKTVLDLGCGYGRLAGAFLDRGYDYTGVDVSPAAVAQARQRYPAGRFVVGDLRSWRAERQFGVVSALYVLVHFVDEAQWLDMMARALSWVSPSGVMLLADEYTDETIQAALHVVQRPLSRYVEILDAHGFVFDDELRGRFLERERRGSAFRIARRRP